jgi:hypothetical protein
MTTRAPASHSEAWHSDPRPDGRGLLETSDAKRYGPSMKVSDMLRRIIRESGLTRYELSKRTGVTEGGLSRFMAGFDVTTRTIDALAKELGLELVAKRKPKAKSREG